MNKRDRIYDIIDIICDIERMRNDMAQEDDKVVSLATRRKQAEDDAKHDRKLPSEYDFTSMQALNEQRQAKREADRKRANEIVKYNFNLRTKKK